RGDDASQVELGHTRRPRRREERRLDAFESSSQALVVEDIAADDLDILGDRPKLARITYECAYGHRSVGELAQYRSAHIAGRTSHQQHRVSYNTQRNIGLESRWRSARPRPKAPTS